MGAIDFHKLSDADKRTIFTTTGEKEGLPAYAIEKDWWVVQTIRIIFQMEVGKQLLFKGGTSLSKAWGLINRFSEDIDLALNREFLGFKTGLISKTQVRKLRTASFEYITNAFYEDLKAAFEEAGFDNVTFDYENLGDGDQDPVSILVQYPALIDHPEYIKPRVKVEIGSRSLKDPYSDRSFKSIVSNQFSDKAYADTEITIPCINPERTYLEKLFLLHEEFQKPEEKIRVDRLSRHLYDLYKISQSEYKKTAQDPALISDIIEHRERFNGMKGVDYKTHYPPNLNPIPPAKYIDAWKADYKKMQNEMIPGESPTFEELIAKVKDDVSEFNDLKFEEKDE
ncbi:MAG: nucleotidyl transferase AbiEii/AbiGii toxin family protein [Saprospiraceae bacterium]